MTSLVRPETHPERRKRPPARFGAGTRRTIAAVAEVVAPAARPFAFDPAAVAVAFLEDYVAYMPGLLARLFPVGLFAFEWAAVLFGGGRRFSRLDAAGRRRYVERVERSRLLAPLLDVWTAVRGLVACAIYSQPEAARRMGYAHQPWLDAKTAERRERFGAPEPW
ncbi:MAG TPA: hypothetical protein VHF22_01565 [Planctomycetota bacterium]|nr:hypothetical protein [Planctomycetota bacterium]